MLLEGTAIVVLNFENVLLLSLQYYSVFSYALLWVDVMNMKGGKSNFSDQIDWGGNLIVFDMYMALLQTYNILFLFHKQDLRLKSGTPINP